MKVPNHSRCVSGLLPCSLKVCTSGKNPELSAPVVARALSLPARIMRSYARNKGPRERVAPDFLIGAHALVQADALLTTDAGFFRHYFEGLNVVSP